MRTVRAYSSSSNVTDGMHLGTSVTDCDREGTNDSHLEMWGGGVGIQEGVEGVGIWEGGEGVGIPEGGECVGIQEGVEGVGIQEGGDGVGIQEGGDGKGWGSARRMACGSRGGI